MKLCNAILVLLLPAISSADYITDKWQAHFGSRACLVIGRAATTEDSEFDLIHVSAYFSTPHRISERRLKVFPHVVADPVILEISVWPQRFDEVEESQVFSLDVGYGGVRSRLIRYPENVYSNRPFYVIGGDEAASAFKHLKDNQDLIVVLSYGSDREIAVELSSDQFEFASAAYDTCVEASGKRNDIRHLMTHDIRAASSSASGRNQPFE